MTARPTSRPTVQDLKLFLAQSSCLSAYASSTTPVLRKGLRRIFVPGILDHTVRKNRNPTGQRARYRRKLAADIFNLIIFGGKRLDMTAVLSEKPQILDGHRLCEKSATAGELASGSPWRLVPCVMAHITGEDRSQLLLLPDAVDDYVGPDNPVRFIDAFVDGFDLETAGFQRVRPNDKGRPGYDPGDLLKLYIYGYLNRIRSSRRLEVETHRNLEVIWLLRQLRPDFKTIADFRRDNRNAFRAVFRQFVRLCRELDLYGRELIAVDGTRIKAVNKRDRNFTRATLKRDLRRTCDRLDRYLDQMNEADADGRR